VQYLQYFRLEYILVIAAVIAAFRAARMERKSPWLWGGLAFGLCLASTFVPFLPYMRVLIAAVLVFVLMMVCNFFRYR
jgi:hypothetical protein